MQNTENPNPIVFISYSWDDEAHKQWVLDLADRLLSHGVDVKLDRYELRLGKHLTTFIENAIKNSHRIIIIFTPNYKLKADNRHGGVGYEYSIINTGIYNDIVNHEKVIPVLRSGNMKESIPDFIQQFIHLNLSDDKEFEKNYHELLREIYNEPEIRKPGLGKKPEFKSKNVNVWQKENKQDQQKEREEEQRFSEVKEKQERIKVNEEQIARENEQQRLKGIKEEKERAEEHQRLKAAKEQKEREEEQRFKDQKEKVEKKRVLEKGNVQKNLENERRRRYEFKENEHEEWLKGQKKSRNINVAIFLLIMLLTFWLSFILFNKKGEGEVSKTDSVTTSAIDSATIPTPLAQDALVNKEVIQPDFIIAAINNRALIDNRKMRDLADREYNRDEYDSAAAHYHRFGAFLNPQQLQQLGWLYLAGLGVKQDYAEAMKLLVKAAEKGDEIAMYYIGALYYRGQGVKQDYTEAMKWYLKAEGKGLSCGYNIGLMWEKGQGVDKDIAKAKEWYRKAMNAGDKDAAKRLKELGE